ncbi:MAG: hypothetical protein HWQ38_15415 [Nostoc sp. NMS7]|uniref:hypothetical protein n=1 Tax=Nostoc sp. NMS7 TaxID=2815391 RepID=UPI0025FAF365|nr:hypothetical protein [Nostoc sp. NMS7]MBN3947764.1 hypothetical protein [Nostoc sp. NMS7]
MSIQSTLTLALEVIFNLFVALMIFDFIDGLYLVPLPPMISIAQPQVVSEPTPSVFTPHFEPISNPCWLEVEPQEITLIPPQFESIPDPWTLELDSLNSTVKTQSLVLAFPTLRLLPPVKEVQQTKRTKTSYQTKSTAKATSTKTKQKTSRPRQKVA